MNATQLLAHFDRLSEAPDAVPRLRRFILDLAVRGKLVEQDARDEPAAMLLKRIHAEKLQCGNGKSSKSERGEVIKGGEPFILPKRWTWTSLGDVADLVRGITFSASDKATVPTAGALPCFRSGNIQKEIVWGDFVYVPKTVLKSDTQLVRANDILISIANSYELVGKSSIVTTVNQEATFGAFLAAIRLFLLPPQFVQHVLASGYSANAFRTGSSQTTNIANITFGTIRAHLIPLPPLAEQHRIVAKVDELMALCDQLEAAQQERERRRDRLSSASLQRLNQPAVDTTPETQREHARFHLHQLPRLTTGPEHIEALRQAILNLAVNGRLVRQNTDDETAIALLKRIDQKRAKLLSADYPNPQEARTQLRKQEIQVLPEKLSLLPDGWSWATLMQCSLLVIDCHNKTAPYSLSGIPLIRTTNVRNGRFNLKEPKFVDDLTYARWSARCEPDPGDILITREAPMGEVAVIPSGMKICLGQRMMLARLVPDTIDPQFLLYSLRDPNLMERVQDKPIGATVQHLRVGGIETLLVPLPPLAEQQRIVAKVDELMALCDQLEAQLRITQTDSRRLLEAVLEAALTA